MTPFRIISAKPAAYWASRGDNGLVSVVMVLAFNCLSVVPSIPGRLLGNNAGSPLAYRF